MSYTLTGSFIEACDCFIVCPCWVDEDADDGHCTGLVAWSLDAGSTIDGTPVHGRKVVSVTAHGSRRRGGTSSTVVFVDHEATPTQARLLAKAFAGGLDGPLAELADVSGRVVLTGQAVIELVDDGQAWSVSVRLPPDAPAADAVDVAGVPRIFSDDGGSPLSLREHRAVDGVRRTRDRAGRDQPAQRPPEGRRGSAARRLRRRRRALGDRGPRRCRCRQRHRPVRPPRAASW